MAQLPPGLNITVSQTRVQITALIGQGGMGSVYSAKSAQGEVVLKRILTRSQDALREVGWEVQVMKRLRGNPSIVNFIAASVYPCSANSASSPATHETFILMENCTGGGLIDLLNRRLTERMSVHEILTVFSDTLAAVQVVHALPLVHRDLKVENILLSKPVTRVNTGISSNSAPLPPQFKLCDFGSCAVPISVFPLDVPALQLLETDLNKNTTVFYRPPEMCDVFQRRPGGITQAADVWALGVLLFKLCYYTTPFEFKNEVNVLSIMNARFVFPDFPVYPPEVRQIVSHLLQERAEDRPDVGAIREVVDSVRAGRSDVVGMFSRRKTLAMSQKNTATSNSNGNRPVSQQRPDSIVFQQKQPATELPPMSIIPELNVVPSRRGRPTPTRKTEGISTSPTSSKSFSQPSVTPVQAVRAALDSQHVWAPAASIGKWKPPAIFAKNALPSSSSKATITDQRQQPDHSFQSSFKDDFMTGTPSYSTTLPKAADATLTHAIASVSHRNPSESLAEEKKFPSLSEFSANFASSSKIDHTPRPQNVMTDSSASTISTVSTSTKTPPPVPSKSIQLLSQLSSDFRQTRVRALSVASSASSDFPIPENPGSSYVMERNRSLSKPSLPSLGMKPTTRKPSLSLIGTEMLPTSELMPPTITEGEIEPYRATPSNNRRHSISNLVSKYESYNPKKFVPTSPKFSPSFATFSSRSSSPSFEIISPRPTIRIDSSPARRWMTSSPNVPSETATIALERIVKSENSRVSPRPIDSTMQKDMDKPFAGVASMISRWESRPTVA